MKALITGATGFIGSHLAERLLKSGYDVSCLVRNPSALKWLDGVDVSLVPGDCCDETSLERVVEGVDYIFHLAGLTKSSSRDAFYAVNERGTENLARAAAKGCPGLKRFVYLSSLSAFGPGGDARVLDKQDEPRPVSDYGKSKLRGEQALHRFSDKMAVTIVRPSVVYGPRDKEFFLVFKCVNSGFMPYWGDGRVSLVYVDDIVDAVVRSAISETAEGQTYHISDDAMYTNKGIIAEIASVLRVKVYKVALPKAVLPAIGFFGDIMSKIRDENSMINSDKVRELRQKDWTCSIDKARKELSFQPGVGLTQGIQWTADWYKIHNWL